VGRRKVREEELSDFIRGLEEADATSIAARPAQVDGWYAVSWDEAGAPVETSDTHLFDRVNRAYWIFMLVGVPLLIWIVLELVGLLLGILAAW